MAAIHIHVSDGVLPPKAILVQDCDNTRCILHWGLFLDFFLDFAEAGATVAAKRDPGKYREADEMRKAYGCRRLVLGGRRAVPTPPPRLEDRRDSQPGPGP